VKRALLGSLIAALVSCPAALAHGGGVPGYSSTVTSVTPAIAGVTLSVLDGDDRLELVNESGQELVVLGYDGEPYLRFSTDGVHRNLRSPATYLNDDRYGSVELPASADPTAEPEWEQVSSRQVYEWHDHRIHWMSEIGPPQVRADPDEPHHVFDWSVPGTAGGEPFTIAGSLDYAPADSGRPPWIYLALPLIALVIAAGAWIAIRRRRAGAEA
jgi:hypothetical protein